MLETSNLFPSWVVKSARVYI